MSKKLWMLTTSSTKRPGKRRTKLLGEDTDGLLFCAGTACLFVRSVCKFWTMDRTMCVFC